MHDTLRARRVLKTDTGTVILHAGLVGTIFVAALTGFAIAADVRDRTWLGTARRLLPQGEIWTVHMLSGLFLAAIRRLFHLRAPSRSCAPYPVRSRSCFRSCASRRTRWRSVNVVLAWLLFAVLIGEIVSGCLLYIGYGGVAVRLHYWLAIGLLLYPIGHVLAHYAAGGTAQLLRIVRPEPLTHAAPEASLADLVAEHFAGQDGGQAQERRPDTLHAHPLSVAFAGALGLAAMAATVDVGSRDTLVIASIARGDAPRLDGDVSDPVWRVAAVTTVETNQGVNFGGMGSSRVSIRAVHDGEWAYFAFTWTDPTRSLKHLPLIKKADGWHVVHTRYDVEDEDAYYEDKFAVMLSASAAMPGGGAVHLGPQPLSDKPKAYSGRGLHYTTDGGIVDVWHWKATRGGLLGWMDDNYFGAPVEPTKGEIDGKSRYKAGYATDNGKAIYANNFAPEPPGGYVRPVQPKRLPKDLTALRTQMGNTDLDPDTSNSEASRWWMTDDESTSDPGEADARIPVGTIIPGVVISGTYSGDRADIRCAARWAGGSGRWRSRANPTPARPATSQSAAASRCGSQPSITPQTRHTRHLRGRSDSEVKR